MSTKNIAKNYMYNLMYQLLVIILPLITTPYLSRALGAEAIGIYSYTISIVTYFTLFGSLGIAMYAQREIAYIQDDKEKRSNIFWEVFILRAITLIISMIIFYFVFVIKGNYSVYYKILLFDIIAVAFDVSAFFQGMEEFKKIVIRNLFVKCISIICIFIFVKHPTDLAKYILIYVLSNLIGNLSLWLYLPKYINKIKIGNLNLIRHLKPTIILFIPQIATQIYTVLDKTMIGTLIEEKSEVGFYEQSQKIVKMMLTVITSMGTVMLPRIANKFAVGEDNKIKKSIYNSFNFVYLLSIPMVFGIISIANDLIPWFLGAEFIKSIYIIYAISPIILFIGLSNVIGIQYLLPIKRQKDYTISVIIGAVINLILNLIFIPKLSSIGAAIGTVIAEFSVTLVQFYFIRKEFNIKSILLNSKKYFISSIIMSIVIILCNKFLLYNTGTLLRIVFDMITGIVLYFVLLLILKDEFLFKIINKIFKQNKKENKI